MAKIALLIGVSEYLPELSSLPAAEKDVLAMKEVLENPDIGEFDAVKALINPSAQEMRIAIENLFSNCTRQDLVLLYFSGHGITDDSSRFYFASRDTYKSDQGLTRSTAVAASVVHEFMEDSRSKRKVVILDCCHSGAFADGMTAKNLAPAIDIQKQLGGEGRAILTSSTSTQYSFEQKGSDLSVYTRYLIEGLETGSADCDQDGAISAEDLHEYAKQKVQEATVAMKPELYVSREGFKIFLAQAPTADPVARFRREVERLAKLGQIPDIHGDIPDVLLAALDAKSRLLEITRQDAETITTEVLKPYREHKRNLRTYERFFREAIANDQSLNNAQRLQLQYLQQSLELSNTDIEWVEQRVPNSVDSGSNVNEPDQPSVQPAPIIQSVKSIQVKSSNNVVDPITSVTGENRFRSKYKLLLVRIGSTVFIGGVIVYLILAPSESWLKKFTQSWIGRSSPEGIPLSIKDACVIADFPVQLFDDPEGVPTGESIEPNTQVKLIGDKEQGRMSNYIWVQVQVKDTNVSGWTFERNLAPCK